MRFLYYFIKNYKRWINKKDMKIRLKESKRKRSTIDQDQEVNTRKKSIPDLVLKKKRIKKSIKKKVAVIIEVAYQNKGRNRKKTNGIILKNINKRRAIKDKTDKKSKKSKKKINTKRLEIKR